MQSIVLSSLLPVILLIAIGFIACCAGWMRATSLKDLGSLVFMVPTPALLFRTMSTVHVERLDFKPVAAYFIAVIGLFLVMLAWRRATQRATVRALDALRYGIIADWRQLLHVLAALPGSRGSGHGQCRGVNRHGTGRTAIARSSNPNRCKGPLNVAFKHHRK